MRIATGSFTKSMLDQFNTLVSKETSLQSQVSTGLAVQSASDDPTAMQNTLGDIAQKSAQKQYSANITALQSRANVIYGSLSSLQTITSRAGELATSAVSSNTSSATLSTYADEVNNLISQVVTAANAKDPTSGQYLFGGTASGTAPYATTKDANGNITAVAYQGNSSVNQTQIGDGQTLSVDIPGENTGTSGARGLLTDSQSGADLLNHLIALRDDLKSGDTSAITTDSTNLQKDENNVAYQVARNGVQQSQLTSAASYASSRTSSLNTMISNSSSANLVETMVQLNAAQTAYQAALQSGTKIMQLSILNYIQ